MPGIGLSLPGLSLPGSSFAQLSFAQLRHPGNHPATHIVGRQWSCQEESAGSMAVENQTIKDPATDGTPLERYLNVHMGNFILLFLTLLAHLLILPPTP